MSMDDVRLNLEITLNSAEKALEALDKAQKIEEAVKIAELPSRNRLLLYTASKEVGVKEWKTGSNPRVESYLDHGTSKDNKDSGLGDDVPWCAGFIAFVLENTKTDLEGLKFMGSTNSLMARSYENWGRSSKDDPLAGDIVTFWRKSKSSGFGHVAIFLKQVGNFAYCLGGNQRDEVNVTAYQTKGSGNRMTDFRRSSKSFEISSLERKNLSNLAEAIVSGKQVNRGGSVV